MADIEGLGSNSLAAELEGWNVALAQMPVTWDLPIPEIKF